MLPIKEFVKRSLAGPVMAQKEFDLHLSRTLKSLVSDHNIHFKSEELICDDATADAIFQAALDLLSRVGLYNIDTSRVVELGRNELLAVAKETPKECTIGGGKDAVRLKGRTHDSDRAPAIIPMPVRSARDASKEQTFIRMVAAYSSEQSVLGELARSLSAELEGIENLADTPGEMMWSRAMAKWARAIAEAIGKPNTYLGPATATSVPAILASYGQGLFERFNCDIPVHLEPELKLDWDRLKLAYAAEEMLVPAWIGVSAMLGVYCRTGEELAVVVMANMLGQLSYGHGDKAHIGSSDREGNRTTRAVIQARSAGCRAAERNVGNPLGGFLLVTNGLGTAKSIYEEAALIVSMTCSSNTWIFGFPWHPGSNGEAKVDLDCRLATRVSRGVAGLSREKANELLEKILGLYELTLGAREEGKPYSYYYDLKTLTPTRELVDLYEREEETLIRLGVPMEGGLIP